MSKCLIRNRFSTWDSWGVNAMLISFRVLILFAARELHNSLKRSSGHTVVSRKGMGQRHNYSSPLWGFFILTFGFRETVVRIWSHSSGIYILMSRWMNWIVFVNLYSTHFLLQFSRNIKDRIWRVRAQDNLVLKNPRRLWKCNFIADIEPFRIGVKA